MKLLHHNFIKCQRVILTAADVQFEKELLMSVLTHIQIQCSYILVIAQKSPFPN